MQDEISSQLAEVESRELANIERASLTGTGGGIFLSPVLLLAGWAETRAASGLADTATYHPTFLYESIWNVLVCLALLWVARRFAVTTPHQSRPILPAAAGPAHLIEQVPAGV